MKKYLLILLGLISSLPVLAGEGGGLISRIYIHEKNTLFNATESVVMFKVAEHTGAPSDCTSSEWAFSIETDFGKAMYSLLLSAAAQNQSVVVKGAGDCDAWKGRERPYYIYVNY